MKTIMNRKFLFIPTFIHLSEYLNDLINLKDAFILVVNHVFEKIDC